MTQNGNGKGDRLVQRRAVGQRIREWRLKREMSQAEVARHAGITQASLSNYENGKRDLPLSTLLGVASALNVSLGELLDMPEMIVVRDSRLGRAVEHLVRRPDLLVPAGADAAS
jgi:transcriptional regulator with XRE-family HTH domain